jgi:hypothetical protein
MCAVVFNIYFEKIIATYKHNYQSINHIMHKKDYHKWKLLSMQGWCQELWPWSFNLCLIVHNSAYNEQYLLQHTV